MQVFITGDRQQSMIYPGLVAVEMIKQLAAGNTLATGTNDGVEAMVRSLATAAGLDNITLIDNPTTQLENGKPDWDERTARIIDADFSEVVAIHADPHTSSIIRSLSSRIGDETLRLVTPADLLV